jgi:hypothetical protein
VFYGPFSCKGFRARWLCPTVSPTLLLVNITPMSKPKKSVKNNISQRMKDELQVLKKRTKNPGPEEGLVLLQHSIYRDLQLPHWINSERNLPQYIYHLRVLQVQVKSISSLYGRIPSWSEWEPGCVGSKKISRPSCSSWNLDGWSWKGTESDWNFSHCIYYRAGSEWWAYNTGAYNTVSYRIIPSRVKIPCIIGNISI